MKPAEFLKQIWLRKKEKSHTYTLSRFAQELKISQPYLSKVLSEKRKLTPKKAYYIGKILKLNDKQLLQFIVATIEEEEEKKRSILDLQGD